MADAEHGVERSMLDQADAMPDPEEWRRRAGSLSENARKHDAAADRIEERESGEDDPDPA